MQGISNARFVLRYGLVRPQNQERFFTIQGGLLSNSVTCQISRFGQRTVGAEKGKNRRVAAGKQGATEVTFKNHELGTSTSLRTFVRVALTSSSCIYLISIHPINEPGSRHSPLPFAFQARSQVSLLATVNYRHPFSYQHTQKHGKL